MKVQILPSAGFSGSGDKAAPPAYSGWQGRGDGGMRLTRQSGWAAQIRTGLALTLALLAAPPARADHIFNDIWSNGQDPPSIVYPNWKAIYAGSFGAWLCDAATCGAGAEIIRGLTVTNFGTAGPGDLSAVMVKMSCGATSSALLTLTYAGVYTEDAGPMNAWTWAGASPDFSACADLCGAPACGGIFNIDVWVDVAPCPTNLATLAMGFPTHFLVPGYGSINDDYAPGPYYDLTSGSAVIAWTYKTSSDTAVAPGDTITYTIFYGKPGTAALSDVVIMDSQPPYTHYVPGSAVPPLDIGWDPDLGPPLRLRWTINPVPANLPAWGPTSEVRFSLSVDWGNGEFFEPGSGDVAPPEGQRLNNAAEVFFNGTTCATKSNVNPPVSTVIKRFMFWEVGDNDILFSPSYGQPPDEMTYSIFIRNLSTQKTWWDVHLWDTVPTDLDVWGPNYGFDDPCTGWTMTPSGCAAASPGFKTGGGKTLLTWHLDMPPGMTLALQWKSRVNATAQAQGTVINTMSIMEYGRAGIVNGTGHSGQPRLFVHLAPIVLPTTYTSYVGYGGGGGSCPGFFIDFFPLNKKAQFELRGIQYEGAGWSTTGGVSASIGCLIGDCLGGFPGSGSCALGFGAIPGGAGSLAGCRVERIPAKYDPPRPAYGDTTGFCPTFPANFIYKVTSNSPVLWQVLTHIVAHDEDNHTYCPSTTLSYTGFMHYVWKRENGVNDPGPPGNGDSLSLINTSMNSGGTYDPALDTTVYQFKFNYGTLTWDYDRAYDIAPESQAYAWTTDTGDEGAYRTLSSQAALIINQGMLCNPQLNQGGHSDNEAAYMPTRETGNTVSMPGNTANFYGICQGANQVNKVVIGNLGATDAVYRIWRYTPNNTIVVSPMCVGLTDTIGTWSLKATHTVPAGLATVNNPRVYPRDGAFFDLANSLVLSKIELISGGPIQVLTGIRVYQLWSGGSVMHPSSGLQAGIDYWLHHSNDGGSGACVEGTQYLNVFCSKLGMAIRLVSQDGYSASYTTTGPDQAVSFTKLTPPANTRNYELTVLPNPAQGSVICQFIACTPSEKGYTAPFLLQGTHYDIIAPPVVFIGQSFWITIIVREVGGTTKLDYCGTTSFTSTDPGSKLEATPMDTYNFTWSSGVCNNNGALPDENGIRIFLNVTMTRLGSQTIVAQDTIDGSINGIGAVLVVAADIKLSKVPRLSVAASGDTVQFRVCWSNFSSASGFSFVITDAVPVGTTYVPEAASAMDCGNTNGLPLTVGSSGSTSPTVPAAASFATGNPPAGTRWLRWTVPYVGVNTTGCACYRVTVN